MAGRIKQESKDELGMIPRRSWPKKKSRSWTSWLAGVAARLAVWYAIVVAIFFCPASVSDLDASSSAVCKPYLQLRDWAAPYAVPYYHTHLAPHVDKVKPYADNLYAKVYKPASKHAAKLYVSYGAPRVTQAQEFGRARWDADVQPRLDGLKSEAAKQYAATLEPHVSQAYDAVNPYIEQSRRVAQQQYESNLLPAYRKALPHVQTAAHHGSNFISTVVWPYAQAAAHHVYVFLARQVWPPLRILYGENVQPQLIKISERLSSYREGKRIQSAMHDADSSIQAGTPAPVDTASGVADTVSSVLESVTAAAATPKSTVAKTTKESLIEDLDAWKVKFSKAADKGTEDLKQRVHDIVATQIESQVSGTGQAHLTQLQEASKSSIAGLHKDIVAIVDTLPEEVYEEDEQPAIDQAQAKIRAAGKSVKDTAQKLRAWKLSLLAETDSLVKDATESTLDVIDHIRDLGLQEIGMRWASHDDTNYEHWSEYHSLKKTFDKWRRTVEKAAYHHEALETLRQAAEDVESEGMALVEDTAKELMRLKQVAQWKIRARDTTDDFATKVLPPAAVRAQQAIVDAVEGAREAVFGQDEVEEPESFVAGAAGAVSSAANAAASSISSVQSVASEAVVDPIATAAETPRSSMASVASSAASRAGAALSEASDSAASAATAASSAVSSVVQKPKTPSGVAGAAAAASSKASEAVVGASKSATSAASKAAAAASDAARAPLDHAQDAVDAASDAAESAYEQAKEAVYGKDDSQIPMQAPDLSSVASKASKSASKSSRSATSAASSIKTGAQQAASQASASVASHASAASDYVSEGVASASASIASAAKEAGEKVAEYTDSL